MIPLLTDRERFLIKVAIASTLEAIKDVNQQAHLEMLHYAAKTKDDPRKEGYYDTHRQFEQLGYVLEREITNRTTYDDDLSSDSWIIK